MTSPRHDQAAELFDTNSSRLFGIAYGMLGSVMDAEDVVQDVFVKWSAVDASGIESAAAYLTTMTTRLAIDKLRSAQHRRETYVGDWLPEPMVGSADPEAVVVEAEQLSLALLTALERLNPVERAVLLLRDVFDFEYAEVAPIVDKTVANCRQIATRARRRVGEPSRAVAPRETEERLAVAYGLAIAAGDVEALVEILADDVILWSDGGGKAKAALHPLAGAERVAKYLVAVNRNVPEGVQVSVVRVNGTLGFMGHLDGNPLGVITFDIADEQITGIRALLNPEKLTHLRLT